MHYRCPPTPVRPHYGLRSLIISGTRTALTHMRYYAPPQNRMLSASPPDHASHIINNLSPIHVYRDARLLFFFAFFCSRFLWENLWAVI